MTVKEFKNIAKNIYEYDFFHKGNFYTNMYNKFDDYIITEINFDIDRYERVICTLDVIEKN